jgi:subfamily B ATP-binding cassette protein HlyB/CyaB
MSDTMAAAPAAVQPNAVDTGLASLCLIARFFGVPAEPGELARRHLAGSSGASAEDLVRIARKLGLKARIVATKWDRLVKTPLPAIAEDRHGAL